jgi:hypothetical protein
MIANGGVEVNIYSFSMNANFTVRTNSLYLLVNILIPVDCNLNTDNGLKNKETEDCV